jgi:hypothetical protein
VEVEAVVGDSEMWMCGREGCQTNFLEEDFGDRPFGFSTARRLAVSHRRWPVAPGVGNLRLQAEEEIQRAEVEATTKASRT